LSVELIEGDCREAIRELSDNSIDSVVTDPPYALTTTLKRFGSADAKPAQFGKDGAFTRASRGFMGKTWDVGDVAHDPAFWAEVLRVLKPGAHLLAFGGTRTYHRLAAAIEDAGFEIRDQIGWAYGSGFPKSHNQHGEWESWGTALKPAWEPIVMARKPIIGTVAENLDEWRTGAINIDGCRVETTENLGGGAYAKDATARDQMWGAEAGNSWRRGGAGEFEQPTGRWPANLIHDGSDEVLAAFPNAPGQLAQAATGGDRRKDQNVYGSMRRGSNGASPREESDKSAARFFYCAKASKKDRGEGNGHPTVKPTELMRYLCRLVTPPGGVVLDPFMGSGSTGRGAVLEGFGFVGIEMDASYFDIADARIAAAEKRAAPRQAAE
jgi:site-specific DNA-methyltransferase (adenine-specific)